MAPGAAAAQERVVESETSGVVTAELSYEKRERRERGIRFTEFSDFRVKISRAGLVLYDRPIGGPCSEFCMPTESALTGKQIGFRDLDGDAEPEVIADFHTGGTSCCVLVHAFGYDVATNSYRRARLNTGAGFVARDYDRNRAIELVGDDFRFRGLFTCGACGARPLRVWGYTADEGGFTVVTREFRGRIRGHARRMRRLYSRARRMDDAAFVKGALTPYVADLCMLDRCGAGFRLVRAAIRRGELERRTPFDVSPLGREYLRALKRYRLPALTQQMSPPRRSSTLRTLSSSV
jgi:hypothetical protein